jgi:molybdopterin molybdotransferase
MDGFAVISSDIQSGRRRLLVVDTIVAGDWPTNPLQPGRAARIMTGAPLPPGADAVVMLEQTEVEQSAEGEMWVAILADDISPGKHTMKRATSLKRGEVVYSAGHRIRPRDLGLLAEVGARTVTVGSRPSTAVLATGNELVSHDQTPSQGQIRNSNGPMLSASAESIVGSVTRLGIGRDDASQLEPLVARGLQHDLLLLSGGVSEGLLDLVPGILNRLGVHQIFHGVAVKPGKPIWFGVLQTDQGNHHVFALPGNPVSSLVGFRLFVRTAIGRMMGSSELRPATWAATLGASHSIRGNRPTYWPGAWVDNVEQQRIIRPLNWQGSSDLRALGQADALIYFPADRQQFDAGETVQTILLD